MPLYEYQCEQGHVMQQFLTVANHRSAVECECGLVAHQRITAPMMVRCQQDICYDSPIDGRPITSWDARHEDLKRNGCRPYDPEMKKDAERFRQNSQKTLEESIDASVAESVTKMSTAQRGKLYSELTEQGKTAEVVRL